MSAVENVRPYPVFGDRKRLWNPKTVGHDPERELPRNWRPPPPVKEPPVYLSDDEYVAAFLGDVPAPVFSRTEPISIKLIQRTVAREFGVPMTEMLSSRRQISIVLPRQVAMYLAKKLTSRSLPEIGRRFGGRDHTTIIHAVKKIEALRLIDPEVDRRILCLIYRLGGEPS